MDCSWILPQAILQFKAKSCQTCAVSPTAFVAPSLEQKLFQTIFFYIQTEPSEISMEPVLLSQKRGTCEAQWLGQVLFRLQKIKSGHWMCPAEMCSHLQKIWKAASLVKEQIDKLSWKSQALQTRWITWPAPSAPPIRYSCCFVKSLKL